MSRPTVSVYNHANPTEVVASVALPAVFTAPIRNDIVHFVHSNIAKNRRQAQGVKTGKGEAGHQTAATSWGTGRAVSRIPRVGGSGTHRSGQAAFGNMCRGGHMYSPLKIWRKWNRKVNQTQKRHATAAAVAATAVGPLVTARGHRVESVNEVPFVVDTFSSSKTSSFIKNLVAFGLGDELARVNNSKKIRTGAGKQRNRRYVMRKGPLVVYNDNESDKNVVQAARNVPGVDVANVHRLNLLKLAPGGHLGRFIIWTKSAFEALNEVFGTYKRTAAEKNGYTLNRSILTTADISRLINSDAVQSKVRAPKTAGNTHARKINALSNKGVMSRLNPFAAKKTELELKNQAAGTAKRAANIKAKRTSKAGKARRTTSLATYQKYADTQVETQIGATKKWYDDIAAQQL